MDAGATMESQAQCYRNALYAVLTAVRTASPTVRIVARRWMEVKTMFQVELLSGGVFTVCNDMSGIQKKKSEKEKNYA